MSNYLVSTLRRLPAYVVNILIAALFLATLSLPAYACSIPKSYYKHVSCTASSNYFLAVKDSGAPVGLLNKQGKKVLDLSRYTQVDVFKLNEGLLPVQRDGKVGYVNMAGREVVPVMYDVIMGDKLTTGWARRPSSQRIIVQKQGKLGIIDFNNKVILPFSSRYHSISDYEANRAQVTRDKGTIWVDENALKVAAPTFNNAANHEGQPQRPPTRQSSARQSSRPSSKPSSQSSSKPSGSNPPAIQALKRPLASSSVSSWQTAKRDGKWGFVNSNDVAMISFAFDDVTPFSEGLAGVKMAGNWGFVDLTGELVIPFRFAESGVLRRGNNTYRGVPAFTFKQGKAWIGNLADGSKLCIDKTGENVPC